VVEGQGFGDNGKVRKLQDAGESMAGFMPYLLGLMKFQSSVSLSNNISPEISAKSLPEANATVWLRL
jgi:hypothetical protein